MSKSLGNVVDPFALVEKYGLDAVRYYLLKEIPTLDDGDFTESRFAEVYNSELAHALGNTASRIAKLASQVKIDGLATAEKAGVWLPAVQEAMVYDLDIRTALVAILDEVTQLEKQLSQEKPWAVEDEAQKTKLIGKYVEAFQRIAWNLRPFIPDTAGKLWEHFTTSHLVPLSPLFPKLG